MSNSVDFEEDFQKIQVHFVTTIFFARDEHYFLILNCL